MGFVLFGISAPVFWLGLMALFVFWQSLDIEALGTGYVNLQDDPVGWFQHLILPWCVLALLFAAFYARMTRGNLIDTMGSDFIRTARAKGLPERTVVAKHGLRASLTPIVTMLGMDLRSSCRRSLHHGDRVQSAGPRPVGRELGLFVRPSGSGRRNGRHRSLRRC